VSAAQRWSPIAPSCVLSLLVCLRCDCFVLREPKRLQRAAQTARPTINGRDPGYGARAASSEPARLPRPVDAVTKVEGPPAGGPPTLEAAPSQFNGAALIGPRSAMTEIEAESAVQEIVASVAHKLITAALTEEPVVVLATRKLVTAGAPEDVVAPSAAQDFVTTSSGTDDVVPATALDLIRPAASDDHVPRAPVPTIWSEPVVPTIVAAKPAHRGCTAPAELAIAPETTAAITNTAIAADAFPPTRGRTLRPIKSSSPSLVRSPPPYRIRLDLNLAGASWGVRRGRQRRLARPPSPPRSR
jgi:hypothetical protein